MSSDRVYNGQQKATTPGNVFSGEDIKRFAEDSKGGISGLGVATVVQSTMTAMGVFDRYIKKLPSGPIILSRAGIVVNTGLSASLIGMCYLESKYKKREDELVGEVMSSVLGDKKKRTPAEFEAQGVAKCASHLPEDPAPCEEGVRSFMRFAKRGAPSNLQQHFPDDAPSPSYGRF